MIVRVPSRLRLNPPHLFAQHVVANVADVDEDTSGGSHRHKKFARLPIVLNYDLYFTPKVRCHLQRRPVPAAAPVACRPGAHHADEHAAI